MNEISDFCEQYQYHQLEKPSGVEVEIPVHKALAMDLLKGGSYRTPPGSDRVNLWYQLGKYLLTIRTSAPSQLPFT